MSIAPLIRGWCPSAWRPMLSGDGYIVRLRPRHGRLSPAQASELADCAETFGDGDVELTARASLQIRAVRSGDLDALRARLVKHDLIAQDARSEKRDAILLQPFWREGGSTLDLERSLREALRDAPDLPGKFGFAIDDGEAPALSDVSADIRIERAADGGLICRADGAATGKRVDIGEAGAAALELARWFKDSGGAPDGRGRMSAHIRRGANLPAAFQTPVVFKPKPPTPQPGACGEFWLVGLPFGLVNARALRALGACGALRVTPWRMLLVESASVPCLDDVVSQGNAATMRIFACAGAPNCTQALQPTRALARALAHALPEDQTLHVSGCAKGCVRPAAANIVLTATAAGFDLIRDGKADGAPILRGLAASELVADPSRVFGRS